VVRTTLLRFPDTLSIRVREPAPGQAEIWIYSRSQIGQFDLGANERRIGDLLRQLQGTFITAAPDNRRDAGVRRPPIRALP
jgi:uncharacterized protein (DUF1499 family)